MQAILHARHSGVFVLDASDPGPQGIPPDIELGASEAAAIL